MIILRTSFGVGPSSLIKYKGEKKTWTRQEKRMTWAMQAYSVVGRRGAKLIHGNGSIASHDHCQYHIHVWGADEVKLMQGGSYIVGNQRAQFIYNSKSCTVRLGVAGCAAHWSQSFDMLRRGPSRSLKWAEHVEQRTSWRGRGHLRRDSVEAFQRGQKSQLIGSVNIVRIEIEHDEEDVDGDRVSESGINVVLSRCGRCSSPACFVIRRRTY
jgi:hypothetical protein